uniref:Hexosyltransferase n=1 Tax=Graphocephala atropunctata TaxID=36148 RepID=A0A1B6LV84_9HEMI
MMAFRVRVLHSIVLSVVGASFIVYSSYYANPVQLYRIEQPHPETMANQTKAPADGVKTELKVEETEALKPSPAKIDKKPPVIQKIPPKSEAESPPHSNKTKTKGGILTRNIYTAGHNLSVPELCPELGARLRLLIVITTAPDHVAARMAVRQTWGHYTQRKDVAIAFCIGTTSKPEVMTGILEEEEMYGDIIQGNFIDSYDNLTLKTVSILEWIDNYCPRAKFVLKTDDDMFINIPKLLEFMHSHENAQRTIFGRLAKKWKPIRNSRSKYYVSVDQFSPPIFPDFTTGPAYLLTSDIIHELYDHALDVTYLKLEDVYTTGIIAQSLNIKRVHINEFLNKRIPFNVCNIKKGISIHMIKSHEQFDLWKKLLDGRSKCK